MVIVAAETLEALKAREQSGSSFIAATAQVRSLVVHTRNEDDFRQTGVPVFKPWMG